MEILPYQGVGPIRFGMTEAEVITLLGAPTHTYTRGDSKFLDYRTPEPVNVILDSTTSKVVEVTFVPPATLSLRGVSLFQDVDAFEHVLEMDGEPLESVGFIVCRNVGISLTGFHDGDESQKAVCVFARGRYDGLNDSLIPFVKS